jgi:predicted NBD/HSP70 family sugar kinase
VVALLGAVLLDDSVSLVMLQDAGKYLGIGWVNLINVFNPELIVFGSTLSLANEFLLPFIETRVRESVLKPHGEDIHFTVSARGEDAWVMSTVVQVLDDILRGPVFLHQIASCDYD